MDKKEVFDRIEYVVARVGAFAQKHELSNQQAYAYLRRFIMGYISAPALVEELKFRGNHAVQYFFGTTKAIELIKRIE